MTVLDTYTLFANADGEAKPEEFPDLLAPERRRLRQVAGRALAAVGHARLRRDRARLVHSPKTGFEPLFNGRDLDGWGFRPTTPTSRSGHDQEAGAQSDKNMPACPIVETPVRASTARPLPRTADSAPIDGRLVVTTPTEGRRIQQLATTRDFPGDFTLKLDFRATPNADSGVFLRGRQLQCRDYPLAGPYKNLKNYKPQDWNELVIDVKGNKAHCTCNGEVLEAAYELPDDRPDRPRRRPRADGVSADTNSR